MNGLLNEEQFAAVSATEGYVRVIAGAGSGKTRTLSHRFAFLVNEIGVMPGNILCVTFTNKSANVMRQRIHRLTGDNDTGYINTFHGFCVSVLQEDISAIGYPKSFLVLDNEDINAMLDLVYEERGLTMRDMPYNKARDMIEIQKLFRKPEYYLDVIDRTVDELRGLYEQATSTDDIIFYGYLYQARKCFGLDYNDLIKFTLYIFRRHEEILHKWQERLEYIMIDEFQDIDGLQYELMEVLQGYHHNLFVVGDPDQTIYTWRGANVRYLLDFDRNFPGTQTIVLSKNYRSTPEILDAANSLIRKNRNRIEKDLAAVRPSGDRPLCFFAGDQEDEALWIADRIAELHEAGVPYRDCTVLYRAHYVTRMLEEVFLLRKLPYVIHSGIQFFERQEIKDSLSYLRMIALQDDLSFRRIVNRPKRNIGKRRMLYLEAKAAELGCTLYQALRLCEEDPEIRGTGAKEFIRLIERFREKKKKMTISELLSAVLSESGYEKLLRTEGDQARLDNLAELKQSVYEYETTCGEEGTLERYLSHIALFSNSDADTEENDKVRMMTIHSAKGLEFPNVFLCEMNEGIIPSRKTNTLEGMEEERRLAFVAVTRAEDRLFLSQADGRTFDGAPRTPSRFLLDIDPACLDIVNPPDEAVLREARSRIEAGDAGLRSGEEAPAIGIGQRIRHRIMGAGTVIGFDRDKNAYQILFDEYKTPRMISARIALEEI